MIRAVLEGLAAALAARRATPADHAALRRRLAAVEAATEGGDQEGLAAANGALHETVQAVAGSADIQRLREGLRAYDHLTRARILAAEDEPARALAEHAAIVNAILAGDAAAAEAAMRAHTVRSLVVALPEAADPIRHWTPPA
jgi:DNA-binding GntR family transcriptional regulator